MNLHLNYPKNIKKKNPKKYRFILINTIYVYSRKNKNYCIVGTVSYMSLKIYLEFNSSQSVILLRN